MQLIANINTFIINPIIVLLFALALLVFFWGIVQYIAKSDSEDEKRKGKQHILWGLVGLAIMTAVRGIMAFLQNSLGV